METSKITLTAIQCEFPCDTLQEALNMTQLSNVSNLLIEPETIHFSIESNHPLEISEYNPINFIIPNVFKYESRENGSSFLFLYEKQAENEPRFRQVVKVENGEMQTATFRRS